MSNQVGVTMMVDSASLKKSFDEDIKLLADMARATDQYNKTAVAGARSAIQAQQEYGKQLGASAEQMRALSSVSTQLETKVAAAGDRMATSAERGARGLSVMARQGTITARSMNQLIAAGADIAFAFGPEGTIISAILMVTAGIVAHFEGAESKMEETVAKFNHSLDEMLLSDSPIDLARARAKAYVDELEAQADAVGPEIRAAQAKVLGNAFGGGLGNAISGFFDSGANSKLGEASGKTASIDAASALLAPIHAHDEEIEGLKKEEEQANAEVTTWREKVDALKAGGDKARLENARAELDNVTSERDAARRRINTLQQAAIDTANAVAAKDPAVASKYALTNPIVDRVVTDFSQEDRHSDAAVSSKRASDRDAAIVKSNAEAARLAKERQDAERRADEMLGQMQDAAVQHQMQAHGLVDEAEKAAIQREFDRRADEIDHLKVSEDRKAQLLIAAAIDRANAVEAIERKSHDRMQAEIAKEAEDALNEYNRNEAKKQRAVEQSARHMESVGQRMADDLVRGQESMGRRLLKAAMEPEIDKLKGWAMSQFAQAAKDAAIQNWIGAAEHFAGGTLLLAGAAELGSLAGGGGGGGSGGSGGGGGGGGGSSSTAAGLGATGNQTGPLMLHLIVVHQDANGREVSRTAQQIQRLDDRNVPIRIGGLG